MGIEQYSVYFVGLDPTLGAEMRKTRPCLVISPIEMNAHLRTVQIAPLTTNTAQFPWRVALTFQKKKASIALDQIRTIDKRRLHKRAGKISRTVVQRVKHVLRQMLVD